MNIIELQKLTDVAVTVAQKALEHRTDTTAEAVAILARGIIQPLLVSADLRLGLEAK